MSFKDSIYVKAVTVAGTVGALAYVVGAARKFGVIVVGVG